MPDPTKQDQIAELQRQIAALEAGGTDAPFTAAELGAMSAADIAARSEEIKRRGIAEPEPSRVDDRRDASPAVDPLEPTGRDRMARAYQELNS